MKKAMLPVGISDFGKLIRHKNSEGNSYLFIDKSLFIKDFIDAGDEISLITRPRRFGKTINLSMLQHFFSKQVNGISTKGLFDGLEISNHLEVMAYQGKYPVIFLTLKAIRGEDFEEAFNRIKEVFRSLFETHDYLLESNKISEEQKVRIKEFIGQQATKSKYETSLLFLSNLLYRHTGKKALIFLDEYDTPLHAAFINNYYEKGRNFIASMFHNAFKGNDFLYKALITGILKIAKSSLFSELNNVEVYTTLSSPNYAQYFGFTEKETDGYLDRANLSQKAHDLKEMYNGYQIEEYTLYNPFSIVSFIKNAIIYGKDQLDKALKPYWINSGGHGIIRDLISSNIDGLEPGLTKLINSEPITTQINEDVIMGSHLRGNEVSFWSLLLLAGYLKPISKEKDEFDDYLYQVVFPNKEIKNSMRNLMLETISLPLGLQGYTTAIKSLINGEIETFKTFLEDYLRYTPSYFDTTNRYKEQFYHGMILGMTACLSNSYIIKSNRESGEGRYDISIEPKDKSRKGIIIELKAAEAEDNLEKLSKTALSQIKEREYIREMEKLKIKEIIPIGIAFRRNEVALSYKLE